MASLWIGLLSSHLVAEECFFFLSKNEIRKGLILDGVYFIIFILVLGLIRCLRCVSFRVEHFFLFDLIVVCITF
jgi:hypothetical protein